MGILNSDFPKTYQKVICLTVCLTVRTSLKTLKFKRFLKTWNIKLYMQKWGLFEKNNDYGYYL